MIERIRDKIQLLFWLGFQNGNSLKFILIVVPATKTNKLVFTSELNLTGIKDNFTADLLLHSGSWKSPLDPVGKRVK